MSGSGERQYNSSFCNGYKGVIGHLDVDPPQRKHGKKIFDWKFEIKAFDKPLPVEVFLVMEDGVLQFRADCQQLTQPVQDSNIEILRQRVQEILMAQAALLSGVTWEDWFEVVVTGSDSQFSDSPHSAWGANLKIQVNQLKRGIHPETGKALTINTNGIVMAFPEVASMLDGDDRMHGILFDHAKERSYIPATPENRRALNEILERMAALKNRLASLLSQDSIQQVLAAPDTHLPLLAKPKPVQP